MGASQSRRARSARLNKTVAVFTILGTLAAFVSLSYTFSADRVQRIACLHNQHEMCDAVNSYEADNAAIIPADVRKVRRYYTDRWENFGTCPADHSLRYVYDPGSGLVTCPNPAHRPR
jgi:hypothetical protein